MTETPPELLPCPFCGGEAERTTIEEEGDNFGGDVITCKRCFASSHVEFGFKENIVSHWNTRTAQTSRTYEDGVRAALRDKIARIITLDHLQLLADFDVDGDLYRKYPECGDAAYVTASDILALLDDDTPAPVSVKDAATAGQTPDDIVEDLAALLSTRVNPTVAPLAWRWVDQLTDVLAYPCDDFNDLAARLCAMKEAE